MDEDATKPKLSIRRWVRTVYLCNIDLKDIGNLKFPVGVNIRCPVCGSKEQVDLGSCGLEIKPRGKGYVVEAQTTCPKCETDLIFTFTTRIEAKIFLDTDSISANENGDFSEMGFTDMWEKNT